MGIFYKILLIYAGAFVIGMFVSAIIWLLFRTLTPPTRKKRARHSFQEMKQIQ